MINLSKVLIHKYGHVANTSARVLITFDEIFKETEELITFRNKKSKGQFDTFSVPVNEITNMKKDTKVSFNILQINADIHKLPYDPKEYDMVITKWNHATLIQPTEKQLEKDFKEYESYLKENAYKELRRKAYPSSGDQLGALMAGGKELEDIQSKIQTIKKKYPKS